MYSTLSRACYNCIHALDDCFRENCIPADGILKTIETVNRVLPGPAVQVCKGDQILIKVDNRLRSQRITSIHWHGLHLKGMAHMDGVSTINQCPIMPYSSFLYK